MSRIYQTPTNNRADEEAVTIPPYSRNPASACSFSGLPTVSVRSFRHLNDTSMTLFGLRICLCASACS